MARPLGSPCLGLSARQRDSKPRTGEPRSAASANRREPAGAVALGHLDSERRFLCNHSACLTVSAAPGYRYLPDHVLVQEVPTSCSRGVRNDSPAFALTGGPYLHFPPSPNAGDDNRPRMPDETSPMRRVFSLGLPGAVPIGQLLAKRSLTHLVDLLLLECDRYRLTGRGK